jgi:hypothetical protein
MFNKLKIFDVCFIHQTTSLGPLKHGLHTASNSRKYSTKKSPIFAKRCQWHRCGKKLSLDKPYIFVWLL